MVGSPPLLAIAFCAACIFGQLVEVTQSQSQYQNQTQPRTDPAEGVPLFFSLSYRLLDYSISRSALLPCVYVCIYIYIYILLISW